MQDTVITSLKCSVQIHTLGIETLHRETKKNVQTLKPVCTFCDVEFKSTHVQLGNNDDAKYEDILVQRSQDKKQSPKF